MRLEIKNLPTTNADRQQPQQRSRRQGASRQLLTFLFFVLLSAALWFIQSMERRFTYTLHIPVRYDSVPPAVGINTRLPEEIQVTLEDTGAHILEYATRGVNVLHVPLKLDQGVPVGFSLSVEELQHAVSQRLYNTARVSQITPQTLQATSYRRQRKVVPVELGALPPIVSGFTVQDRELTPSEVTIFGSREQLDGISKIYTAAFAEEQLSGTTTTKVGLQLPEGIYASTRVIQVHLAIERLIESSLTLPLSVLGVPEGQTLYPLPSRATLQLRIPYSRSGQVRPEDFALTVTYPQPTPDDHGQLRYPQNLAVELSKKPSWVKYWSIQPDSIQYVIESDHERARSK